METREKQCQLAQVADPAACGGGPLIAEQGKVGRSAWEAVMGGGTGASSVPEPARDA